MKISSLAPFLLLKSILISEAQRSTDVIDVSFEVMRAANNLDSVVMEFQKESGNFQPSCGDPLDNCTFDVLTLSYFRIVLFIFKDLTKLCFIK